jgi:hypothetical protein
MRTLPDISSCEESSDRLRRWFGIVAVWTATGAGLFAIATAKKRA